MNKTLILLLLFVVLGGGTAWFLMQKPDAKMTVLQEERAFHIDNPDEVYKIFLADRRGNKTTLERKSD
ncbi:MAG: hypothetical protein AAF990_19980, partial [Bacteroidota bacterium]